MAATTPELDFSDAQAKKLVKLAIENGAYSDDMPTDKKAIKEAAVEAVEYCIDSWINDNVRPDEDDPDLAAAGEAIAEIFEVAGIETDEEGNIITEAADDGDPEGEGEDGEEAFNPDDYIEGWTELTPKAKVEALNDLDLDDEDTLGIVNSIRDWENEQDKPSSRVLSWIDEALGEAEGEPEADAEGSAMEEPWEGYDKASAVDVKGILKETMESDDGLEVEQVQYVLDYESSREKPPPRKRIIDYCNELIAEIESGGAEPEPEEKPKPLARKAGKTATKTTKAAKPLAKASVNGSGSIVLTREQILTALDSGEVEIEFGE